MPMLEYFDAQAANLGSAVKWEPFAKIFPRVDDLYLRALKLAPTTGQSPVFGQFLLICHKSFLAAASLIGQAQPGDAGPITRRAIEVARVAAAFKTDPDNADKWLAIDEREKRWADRLAGKKPERLNIHFGAPHPDIKPVVDDLMDTLGILSDAAVHFTPEHFHTLDWVETDDSLHLTYFTKDQRELECEIVLTSATHIQILEVLNWCLDDAFTANEDWSASLATLFEQGKQLADTFGADQPES